MSIALLTHTGGVLGVSGGTSSAIDTSGAALLVVGVVSDAGSTVTLSDSKGNSWTGLTAQATSGSVRARLYYCNPTSVGSGHTVSLSGSSQFSAAYFASFSGAHLTAPFDNESGQVLNSGGNCIISFTPNADNELIITVGGENSGSSPTVTSFTLLDSNGFGGGDHYGGGMAYIIQTTATPISAVWTVAGNRTCDVLAAFKVAAPASAPIAALMRSYRQRRL